MSSLKNLQKIFLMSSIWNALRSDNKPWKILAPMVGNSEEAYRILARRHKADLCYTEMVHCRMFNKGNKSPVKNHWYTTSSLDRPLVIQVCGNDPDEMLKACLAVQDHCDAIDINLGCPQAVAKAGRYGAYLQDDWELLERIVSHLSSNLRVPLFCKIRVFPSVERTVEYARMLEKSGCALLAVHGRTRDQKGEMTGLASWEHIRCVKEGVRIPVVANGNMIRYEDIESCVKFTKCDGVMLAEPHLYNPLIFEGGLEERREDKESLDGCDSKEMKVSDGSDSKEMKVSNEDRAPYALNDINAQNSPSNAQNSPSNAQNSPSNAQNSPSNAQNSPSNAQNSPSNAQNSPSNAQNNTTYNKSTRNNRSTDVLKEYISIIKTRPDILFQYKCFKSHAFKILKDYLNLYPEKREVLNDCESLKDFEDFVTEMERSCTIERAFLMTPYLRGEEYVTGNDKVTGNVAVNENNVAVTENVVKENVAVNVKENTVGSVLV